MLSPRRAVRLAFVSRRQGAVFRYARRTPSPNGGMRRALRSTTRIEAGAQSIAAEYHRCRRCTGAARAGTAGRLVTACGDGVLRLWDARDGALQSC